MASIVILFLLAAAIRVGWVAMHWGLSGRAENLDYPDEEAYVLTARSLAAGNGLMDEFGYRATYMPGYPAFLAIFQGPCRSLLLARIAQAILAAWIAPPTFLLALSFVTRKADKSAALPGYTIPILAGLAAAVDPFLVFFSGLLLTEALFAATLVTAWFFLFRLADDAGVAGANHRAQREFRDTLACSFLLWLAVMFRPSSAILLVLTPLALLVFGRFRRQALVRAVVVPSLVLIGLVPWAARNRAVIGQWQWLSTRGGISLYDGLHPGATGASDLADTKTMPEIQGLSEVQWDRYFHDRAVSAARRDPICVIRLAGLKFLRTWSLIPHVENYRAGPLAVVAAGWMLIVLILAGLGWWSSRWRVADCFVLLLPVAAFTLLHMVYVGSVRYRVPLTPFLMVLAAVGLCSGCQRIFSTKTKRA